MIIVSGPATLRPGALAAHATAMRTAIDASRLEPGCLFYAYGVDVTKPDTLNALEYWKDDAALTGHFATAHMRVWIPVLKSIIVSHDVRIIDGGAERRIPL